MVWELFENAKKFHPQMDPCVKFSAGSPEPGVLSLSIADDGAWIPIEHLAHVLKPYYQGEKTYTGELSGMGLGLPTVAAIIWQAGGSINVQNRPDRPGVVVEMSFRVGEDCR